MAYLLVRTMSGELRSVRYFLLLSKCGTHQAALSAKNGVMGRAAASAAEDAGEGRDFEGVTANAVRLFKYLVSQYYEDFQASVTRWVHDTLDLVLPNDASHSAAESQPQAAGGQPQAARLQALYTKHVIPDDLLEL